MKEERELPVGWIVAPIAELAIKVGSGATPKGGQNAYLTSGIPLIRSMNVVFFGFKKDGLAFISEGQAQQLSNAEVRRGDVLLNITGASIGRVTTAPEWSEGSRVNQHVCIIRPSECLDHNYLSAYLSSPAIQTFILDENYGVTRQALTKQQVLELEIPVPPINEQHRIAAKLDTTLAAVDACRQRLDGVAAILKRFRHAVLAAATSGELTREWREERSGSLDDWAHRRVEDVVTAIEAGLNVQCDERPPEDHERGLVKISAVTWGIYDEQESKTLAKSAVVLEKNRIQVGDFLISRANTIQLIGSCVLVYKTSRNLYLSDKVLRLVMPRKWKLWLLWCLKSPAGRKQIEELSSGNQLSMRNLSQKSLLSIRIQLPPVDELEKIVDVTNDILTLANQLEIRLTAARKIVDRLTPALLAKAFRGELVPQDPNDEPASVLLERIRAARQAEATAAKPSRRGRPKAAATPEPIASEAAPAPADFLTGLLRECGALSERALLAASELEPQQFQRQLQMELENGTAREIQNDGQVLLEAVG